MTTQRTDEEVLTIPIKTVGGLMSAVINHPEYTLATVYTDSDGKTIKVVLTKN
jgi:hypothetical protein